MKDLIEQLVMEKREDEWWDFKLKHHTNLVKLLHDVLCMANILYKGDRYIIFGISDDYKIVGISKDDRRNTQADILDFLRKKSFANHNIPKIEIHVDIINGKEIDVLTIKDSRDKPYYLTRDEKSQGCIVRAGVVYSRLGDTNTPIDSCANPYEVEAMWRKRFGLDDKASDRFIQVLLDFKNWQYDGESLAFYDIDPDYTIKIGESESSAGKFWWEKGLFEKPTKCYYHLRYKNIELHKISVVEFESENLYIPFPNVEYVTYPEKKDDCVTDIYCDLFYFQRNTIKYSLFEHIRALEVKTPTEKTYSTPIETQIKPPRIKLPFLILDNEHSLKAICEKIISRFDDFLTEKQASTKISEIEGNEKKRIASERLFSEWAFRLVHDNGM